MGPWGLVSEVRYLTEEGWDSVCIVGRVRVVCVFWGDKAGCVLGRGLMACVYWVRGSESGVCFGRIKSRAREGM